MIRAKIQWYTPIHVQSSRLSLWFSGDVDIRWRSFQKRCRESIVFKYITRIQEIFTWTEKTRFPRILVIEFTKLPKEFSVFPRFHGRFPQKRNYVNADERWKILSCCTHILVHSYCFAPRVGVLLGLKARSENNLYGIYQLFRSTLMSQFQISRQQAKCEVKILWSVSPFMTRLFSYLIRRKNIKHCFQ